MTKINNLSSKLEAEFGAAIDLTEAIPVDGILPQCQVAPHNEEITGALVKWCGQNGVAFIPRGGGTKLHIGAKPSRCELVISTQHLNQVIEHDEGNATVQAQSGITLDELNQVVGEGNQFVPLHWDAAGAATLGGAVATNHSGATKLRYGAPRDLVVGLHAMLSDGRHVKAGSKVVKNVSGYDLNKLFVGSFGTLGLMTQVTIRLRPNDALRKKWSQTFSSWGEVEAAAQQILSGPFEPALLRVVARGDKYILQARFDGGGAAVNSQLEKLPPVETSAGRDSDETSELELRATLPLTRAGAWAQAAQQAGAHRVFWDYGLGSVRAEFTKAPVNGTEVMQALRENVIKNEGFVVVERAPEELKTPEFVWGNARGEIALMQTLKRAFDAANICVPGRFIGGI